MSYYYMTSKHYLRKMGELSYDVFMTCFPYIFGIIAILKMGHFIYAHADKTFLWATAGGSLLGALIFLVATIARHLVGKVAARLFPLSIDCDAFLKEMGLCCIATDKPDGKINFRVKLAGHASEKETTIIADDTNLITYLSTLNSELLDQTEEVSLNFRDTFRGEKSRRCYLVHLKGRVLYAQENVLMVLFAYLITMRHENCDDRRIHEEIYKHMRGLGLVPSGCYKIYA